MDPIKVKMGIKGFTVQFSEENSSTSEGGVVVFNKALCNVDNCYNTGNGVFTAPKTGAYAFYISGLLASDDFNRFSDLVIEKTSGHPLQKVFLRGRSDIYVGSQGSFFVRCKLEKGEGVQLRHIRGDTSLKGQSWTTFSGVLEYEYADSTYDNFSGKYAGK